MVSSCSLRLRNKYLLRDDIENWINFNCKAPADEDTSYDQRDAHQLTRQVYRVDCSAERGRPRVRTRLRPNEVSPRRYIP